MFILVPQPRHVESATQTDALPSKIPPNDSDSLYCHTNKLPTDRTNSHDSFFPSRLTESRVIRQEFNQNLLESSCPYIAYPTSIDLDDSNPYCRDILNLLENRNDFENSERELHNIKISEINNKTYLHLFTKVHHYDSVTYRDIFAVLKEFETRRSRNEIQCFQSNTKLFQSGAVRERCNASTTRHHWLHDPKTSKNEVRRYYCRLIVNFKNKCRRCRDRPLDTNLHIHQSIQNNLINKKVVFVRQLTAEFMSPRFLIFDRRGNHLYFPLLTSFFERCIIEKHNEDIRDGFILLGLPLSFKVHGPQSAATTIHTVK
ncbi:hypothetical protein K1T71_006259 [Dendrolimus kikuchii]|uniref:Uncharacterized protein n=1 Tax=Dendrolimus kikuchii TaxID=765133 RepID=A0ACC1D3L2_9NEOP|nr:hypothetical protein K1T71_006259 [Dendrolimus kikuchii]